MSESLKSEETIRDYLLGRVSDEETLSGVEELLFADEEFCDQVSLTEDSLINDYVLGRLNDVDAASFRSTLASNSDRLFKVQLTQSLREKALARGVQQSPDRPSFFAALSAFFHQPKYVGVFAIVLLAAIVAVVYFSKGRRSDELAELRSMYKQSRPTETRISEFDYAPLSQLRGEPTGGEQSRLRRIELSLIESTEKNPGAKTYHALGIVYLAQQQYSKAIPYLETARTYDDKSARLHNDLGVAHFELAKTAKEKKFEELSRSLEEFTRAVELDGNLLEALFNKSLALQELRSSQKARESWQLYLQKDPSSAWANEARKNLANIESGQISKTYEQTLEEFLSAYRSQDETHALLIHDETKGLFRGSAIALQLSRKYLIARQHGDEITSRECLDALNYLGRYESEHHSEFFFLS